ncbi:amino acid ABC transporter substrate-binding protein [Streptomyces sp. AN091965]|uniref:amino acid ABC transporter substrate-binding protein n=1 Tax=Streptomyces sp. AN091965 TaxID=2927803 RepID=UPI001F601B01|nr:amino acid ABC transporter substrate-binding protein [Streptomyces sp. AN091965]MCI3931900.1 amino acid ABC transporter substrate-binding protein [Streptomyces sp. AN091965]
MLNWLYNHVWATRLKKAVTILVVAAVGAAVGILVPPAVGGPDHCADGVEKHGGECVGINGSGYDFGTSEISRVSAAIARENRRIDGEPHVTVAMMLPLQPESAAERTQLRSDVQGAYLAQYRANRTEQKPLIRLVLANPGRNYAQQARVVDDLAELADDRKHNLRAVTGFNLSLRHTVDAVDRLTNELRVPVLISRASADELANVERREGRPRFPGLARVIPTNRQQAAALAAFHHGLRDEETVLVKDTRPDDIYVESLARAFSGDEAGPPGAKDQEFTSPSIGDAGETGNDFSLIGHNICQSRAKVVYFAGRPVHLRLFALKLAEVPCRGKRYTVVSGSGAATLDRYMSAADWRKLRGDAGAKEPTVTVQYTAPGHPEAWSRALAGAKGRPAHLAEPQRELAELRALTDRQGAGDIGPVHYDDSRTMLVHDGVLTISRAVFLANARSAGSVPPRERVAAQWSRLESAHRVAGTSGWVCLTNAGNPYDKPVAVVELDPRTRKLRFVGLGWPGGRPQPRDCVVPSG